MRQGLLRAFLQRHATRAAKARSSPSPLLIPPTTNGTDRELVLLRRRCGASLPIPARVYFQRHIRTQRSGKAWQGDRGAQPLGGGEMSGLRGTAHPSSKLTEDQVREIRRLLKAGQSLAKLAKRFGVSRTAIRNIGNGRKWRWLAD